MKDKKDKKTLTKDKYALLYNPEKQLYMFIRKDEILTPVTPDELDRYKQAHKLLHESPEEKIERSLKVRAKQNNILKQVKSLLTTSQGTFQEGKVFHPVTGVNGVKDTSKIHTTYPLTEEEFKIYRPVITKYGHTIHPFEEGKWRMVIDDDGTVNLFSKSNVTPLTKQEYDKFKIQQSNINAVSKKSGVPSEIINKLLISPLLTENPHYTAFNAFLRRLTKYNFGANKGKFKADNVDKLIAVKNRYKHKLGVFNEMKTVMMLYDKLAKIANEKAPFNEDVSKATLLKLIAIEPNSRKLNVLHLTSNPNLVNSILDIIRPISSININIHVQNGNKKIPPYTRLNFTDSPIYKTNLFSVPTPEPTLSKSIKDEFNSQHEASAKVLAALLDDPDKFLADFKTDNGDIKGVTKEQIDTIITAFDKLTEHMIVPPEFSNNKRNRRIYNLMNLETTTPVLKKEFNKAFNAIIPPKKYNPVYGKTPVLSTNSELVNEPEHEPAQPVQAQSPRETKQPSYYGPQLRIVSRKHSSFLPSSASIKLSMNSMPVSLTGYAQSNNIRESGTDNGVNFHNFELGESTSNHDGDDGDYGFPPNAEI